MNADSIRPCSRRGLTLVEMLVAAAVVVVLVAMVVGATRFALSRARSTACLGQLRSIGVAIESWLQDHNDRMPELQAGRRSKADPVPVLENTLDVYLPVADAFRCPADSAQFAATGSSYLWNSTQSGRHKLRLEFFGSGGDPRLIPLVSDKQALHPGKPGVNILYADYRVSGELRLQAGP